jgi:hypothetical protein
MWLTISLTDLLCLPAAALSMRVAGAIVLAQAIHYFTHREG